MNTLKWIALGTLLSFFASSSFPEKSNQEASKARFSIKKEEKKPKLLEQAGGIHIVVNYHYRAALEGREPVFRSTKRYADLKFYLIDGANCLAQKKYDGAIKCFELATEEAKKIEENGAFGSLYYYIARAKQEQGKIDEALDYFKKAIEFDEKINYAEGVSFALFKRGLLKKKLGKNEDAKKDLEDALKKTAKNKGAFEEFFASVVYDSLTSVCLELKERDNAISYSKKAKKTKRTEKLSTAENLKVKRKLSY